MLKIRGATRDGRFPVVPVLLISQCLINIGLGTFGVLYNLYLTAIGQSLAYIGTFNAVSILALGLSAMLIGAGSRLMSRRQTLSLGVLLLVAVQIVLALSATPSLLLIAGILWGVAQALCLVPVGPWMSESVPRTERVAAFGQLYATWALAAVIGSVLGGALPGLLAALLSIGAANGAAAYRGAMLVTTAITLLGFPLLRLPLAAETETAIEAQVEAPVGHGWALRTVRRTAAAVVVTMAIYSFAGGLVAPFLNVYFAQKLHLATSLIGVLFALAALLSVPGSLLGTRLSRRWGTVQAVAVLRMAIFPCLLALALGALVPILAVAGFLVRFALIFMAGSLDAHFTLAAFPSTARTFAAGLRTGIYNLGWALGAWSAGQLLDRTGYAALFVTSGVLTAIASVLFLGLFGLPVHAREQPTE